MPENRRLFDLHRVDVQAVIIFIRQVFSAFGHNGRAIREGCFEVLLLVTNLKVCDLGKGVAQNDQTDCVDSDCKEVYILPLRGPFVLYSKGSEVCANVH